MSESLQSEADTSSDEDAWDAGFDVVDFETTPMSERPEDDGFHLICPLDGCEHEAEFDHLNAVADSEWSGLSLKDRVLTDGTTLKEAYCPSHSLEDQADTGSDREESLLSKSLSNLRERLGIPLDANTPSHTPEKEKDEYAIYDFLSSGETVVSKGYLVTCRCESCYKEEKFSKLGEAEEAGWVSGKMVGTLSDGHTLYKGRCPEHGEG